MSCGHFPSLSLENSYKSIGYNIDQNLEWLSVAYLFTKKNDKKIPETIAKNYPGDTTALIRPKIRPPSPPPPNYEGLFRAGSPGEPLIIISHWYESQIYRSFKK